MKLHRIAVATAVLAATACAPVQKQVDGSSSAAPSTPEIQVSNKIPFDIAVCQPAPTATLPQPANPDILMGAMVTLRPYIMECLVPASSRGAQQQTRVVLKARVDEQGATHTVSGENLTPEGQACIQKIFESHVLLAPQPKGAAPASAEVDFAHQQGRSMAVTPGPDSGSDYSGAVRLGQPQWCDCYAAYAGQVPPVLKSRVVLLKGQATPAEVAFEPVGTPEGDALAACLQQKMMALPVPPEAESVQFSRVINHFNSKATQPAAHLPPEHRFLQSELVRLQRSGQTTLATGARSNAADAYVAAEGNRKLAAELPARCKAMVDAGTQWVAALQAQLQAEQELLTLSQEMKNPQAAAQFQQLVQRTQAELEDAQQRFAADQRDCAKVIK